MRRLSTLVLGLALAPPLAFGAGNSDWLTDESGVLELKLAHLDKNGPDGGILKLDRTKRTVLWQGAGGDDIACKVKVEISFDDVKDVSTASGPGFILDLKKGKPKRLTLIPVFHVRWLIDGYKTTFVGSQQGLKDSGVMRGPDGVGTGMNGDAASAGPTLKAVQLPKDVVADTQQAVDQILSALGRH
jgi:hypothetical protein